MLVFSFFFHSILLFFKIQTHTHTLEKERERPIEEGEEPLDEGDEKEEEKTKEKMKMRARIAPFGSARRRTNLERGGPALLHNRIEIYESLSKLEPSG